MPERFRYLTKEVPERPVRWPWLFALVFLVYAWRTVLWELTNWKKAGAAILRFIGYISKLAFAFLLYYIGDLITGLIRCIEFFLYNIRYFYGSIVAFAPVPELMRIIFFSSTVIAIAEATVDNPVNSQPYLLTLAGIVAFGAVKGFIPEPLFWFSLAAFFTYSRFIKKRDNVTSALPAVAVFAAVGEPWVRALVIGSYLALAIAQYAETSKGSVGTEVSVNGGKTPTPLLLVALAIGIHVAAKWVRRRHLTWMIA